MPLYPNQSQPYFLDPNSPNRYSCAGQYLYPVQPSDIIYWQGYQTPCGQNIVIDPGFEEFTLGAELIANGSFSGAGSWTFNDGFAYVPFSAVYTGTIAGGELLQAIAISLNDLVEVTFTVSGNWNGGYMEVRLGTTVIASITEAGTYTVSGLYNAGSAELSFFLPAGSPVSSLVVDDVSAKIYTQDSWDGNGEWTFVDGFACHSIAGTAVLDNTGTNYIVSGKRYRVTFVISGSTNLATVTVRVGTTAAAAVSGNGTKTVWIDATSNGLLNFVPTSTFEGCISEPDVREMKVAADFGFDIISDLGDGDVTDITDYVELYEDYVTLIYDPQDDNLNQDCYILRIYDTCTIQYEDQVLNGTFFGGTITSVDDWFRNNGTAQYDLSGDQAKFLYDGSFPLQVRQPTLLNTVNPLLVAGNYQVTFDIISNTDTTNIGMRVYLNGKTPANTFYSTVGTHTYQILNYDPADDVDRRVIANANFNVLGVDTPGNIVIDNVKVFRIAPFDATYTSVGLAYQNVANTRLIRAYCDKNNFGFEFENSGFYLQQRVKIRSINPSFPSQVNIANSGNGTGRITYAEQAKYFTVFTDLLDESAHEALSIQLKCDHLLIGETVDTMKEYLHDGEEYSPQWFGGGVDSSIAQSVFNLRIKDGGQIFNRHY